MLLFIELLPIIASFLEEESDANAGLLLIAIRDPRLLIGLVVTECALMHTLEPSRTLQKKDGDIVSAYMTIREIEILFRKFREDAKRYFHDAFVKAENLLVEVGSSHDTISVPRLCRRQTQRSNIPHENSEEYYRRVVYIPFLDHVLTELRSRFGDDTIPVALQLNHLTKGSKASRTDVASILQAAKLYERDVESLQLVKAEVERWVASTSEFQSARDAYVHASTRMFPNLARLLNILLTLPVTNAEAERSFSALKRLKSFLRNTIGQERLNGLAVHNEIPITVEEIMKVFCESNRKLLLE